MKLAFMGPPGSGKGTQAKRLQQQYGIAHISTGDVLRSYAKREDQIGEEVRDIFAKGTYASDDLVNRIISQRIQEPDCAKGFVLDGYPRTVPQAKSLETMTKLDAALCFLIPDEEIYARIGGRRSCTEDTCGASYHITVKPPQQEGICDTCDSPLYTRKDDTPEVIAKRITTYETKTLPMIEFYKNEGVIHFINAQWSIEKVASRVEGVILPFAQKL